jgi:hypothetical protein
VRLAVPPGRLKLRRDTEPAGVRFAQTKHFRILAHLRCGWGDNTTSGNQPPTEQALRPHG